MSETAKELREKLMIKERRGAADLSAEILEEADRFCVGYKDFLDNSRTEREAVAYVRAMAEQRGFTEFEPDKKYAPGDKVYIINRDKAIGLAIIGKNGTDNGVRLSIAHIDSPRIDLKPNPLYQDNGMALFKTHYYGGIKKYQWTAIPLAMHGRVVKADGTTVDIRIGDDPGDECFLITDLLPHLDKDMATKTMSKAFTGEDLNILVGSRPYDDSDEKDLIALNVMKILNDRYGIAESDFLSAELNFCPAFKTRDVGFDRSMIAGYGHDDRCCAFPAAAALMEVSDPETTSCGLFVDKEEIGSVGATGMESRFFENMVREILGRMGEYSEINLSRCLRNSRMLSSDVSTAYDPLYADKFEKKNTAKLGHGLTFCKFTGARGKSGANDANAEYLGQLRNIMDKHDVVYQTSELGKVDVGGGGTIAYILSLYGMQVIDCGVPILSMHSPWETLSKSDLYEALKGYKAFLTEA